MFFFSFGLRILIVLFCCFLCCREIANGPLDEGGNNHVLIKAS